MSRVVRRTCASSVLLVIVLTAAGATGADGLSPSASVTTAIQGWEHWLQLEWTTAARSGGQDIDGYVYNKYGVSMYHVQLLAQGLDGTGNVVHQQLAWVPGTVPGLQRAYFRIPNVPLAQRYRVTVWAFNLVSTRGLP
jgi:hypothetical protein